MKTITLLLLLSTTAATAQLNGNAIHMKKAYPSAYENKIKRFAIEEWGSDHSMVIYEINKQADAITELVRTFQSKHTREVIRAIREWTISGFDLHTEQELQEMTEISRKQLLRFYCDWSMVVYEYKKQVKAKQAY